MFCFVFIVRSRSVCFILFVCSSSSILSLLANIVRTSAHDTLVDYFTIIFKKKLYPLLVCLGMCVCKQFQPIISVNAKHISMFLVVYFIFNPTNQCQHKKCFQIRKNVKWIWTNLNAIVFEMNVSLSGSFFSLALFLSQFCITILSKIVADFMLYNKQHIPIIDLRNVANSKIYAKFMSISDSCDLLVCIFSHIRK